MVGVGGAWVGGKATTGSRKYSQYLCIIDGTGNFWRCKSFLTKQQQQQQELEEEQQ